VNLLLLYSNAHLCHFGHFSSLDVAPEALLQLTATGHSHKLVTIQSNPSTHEKVTAQNSAMAQGTAPHLRELLDWWSSLFAASLFSQVRDR
jgi:hypothetical protein